MACPVVHMPHDCAFAPQSADAGADIGIGRNDAVVCCGYGGGARAALVAGGRAAFGIVGEALDLAFARATRGRAMEYALTRCVLAALETAP